MILGNRLSVLTKKTTPTKLKFHLTSNLTQPLYLTQSSANAVTVDWGDGSATEQSSSLAASFSHKYAAAGDYEVKVACADGESWSPGGTFNSKVYSLLGDVSGKSPSFPTLTKVSIGTDISELTSNSGRGFSYSTELSEMTLPSSLKKIGGGNLLSGWFTNCEKLKRVNVESLTYWFSELRIVADSPIYNGGLLYINGIPQINIIIPDGITELKSPDFAIMGSGIEAIDTNDLASVKLNASSLRSVIIGKGCSYVSPNDFYSKMQHLTELKVSPDNPTYTSHGNCIIKDHTVVVGISNSILPSDGSITKIGGEAFRPAYSIVDFTVPSSITVCDVAAFSSPAGPQKVYIEDLSAWCRIEFRLGNASTYNSNPLIHNAELYLNNEKVTSLIIPADISEVSSATFINCKSITSITLHENITKIGLSAFAGCTNVTAITSLAVKPPRLWGDAFKDIPATCPIYVPAESVEAYKADWSARKDYIQAKTV